ncbi:MAG: T9SS type A sorting domain-containing protein [bacterium]
MKQLNWFCLFLFVFSIINYPNPVNFSSNQTVTFEASADTATGATLYIYDMGAKLVNTQAITIPAGTSTPTTWNGYSLTNTRVGNGIYLYQIISSANERLGRGKIWVINQ